MLGALASIHGGLVVSASRRHYRVRVTEGAGGGVRIAKTKTKKTIPGGCVGVNTLGGSG